MKGSLGRCQDLGIDASPGYPPAGIDLEEAPITAAHHVVRQTRSEPSRHARVSSREDTWIKACAFMGGRCKNENNMIKRKAHRVQPYLYREPSSSPHSHMRRKGCTFSLSSPVRLSHTFELVLFLSHMKDRHQHALDHTQRTASHLDSIRVRGTLGSVDELIRKTLCNRLDITERRFASLQKNRSQNASQTDNEGTYTNGEKRDRLVHSPQRRHVDGLTTDRTLRTDTRRVFSRTRVDDRVHEDLGARYAQNPSAIRPNQKSTHLNRVLVREEVNNLKRMRDDANGQQLFAVVTTFHHQTM